MASNNTTSPDTQVTLKINFDGMTRRHKLPLRDMGPSTLEERIRALLAIAQDANVVLERYSDSAGSYITLDKQNVSVYKQLYRAAKAKQKLKLRVNKVFEEKMAPRPVSVEDVPEPSTLVAAPKAEQQTQPEVATPVRPLVDLRQPADVEPKKGLPTSDTGLDFEASILASLLRRHARLNDEEAPATPDVPVAEGIAARNQWFANAAAPETSPFKSPWGRCPALTHPGTNFAVCCNHCDETIPDAHYHCSTCDDGDFDLCQDCVEQGVTCYGAGHWLIKRVVKNGQIVNSTTQTIAPKNKSKAKESDKEPVKVSELQQPLPDRIPVFGNAMYNMRTCNCCVTELPEASFLHCTTCEDFDLCHACFEKDSHGHNPKHPFVPAVEAAHVPSHIRVKLSPGRNQSHNAICDGCDKYIAGVRHKCLDCPDWDYCADCIVNSKFVHPNHRFVPIYEPLEEVRSRAVTRSVHFGICCDGPLCASTQNAPAYITGVRYKCTVCHDTDFCANCEASPANTHNKTHPLVKFKTPVRHVTVTTTGERGDGQRMQQMGDRNARRTSSRSTETTANASINTVQTVVDVKPTELAVKEEAVATTTELMPEVKSEPEGKNDTEAKMEVIEEKPSLPVAEKPITEQDLAAVFVRDTVADGTILPPNHVFEQTWVLRNDGEVAWPAGCSVKFVGGDYMGHVDSNHPAGISELVSASESTVCYAPLAPGQEFSFNVLLRTPAREGKIISYWRLTTKDGLKFGHRLWCDVSVQSPKPIVEEPKEVLKEIPVEMLSSNMIFPKLEKESPVSSFHEDVRSDTAPATNSEAEEFEDCGEDDEWDASDDGFMTDEEYDILDASDEEFLEEQQRRLRK